MSDAAENIAHLVNADFVKADFLLPIEPIESHIKELAKGLSADGNDKAVNAIMTTDTVPKQYAVNSHMRLFAPVQLRIEVGREVKDSVNRLSSATPSLETVANVNAGRFISTILREKGFSRISDQDCGERTTWQRAYWETRFHISGCSRSG